jgi:NADPH:quinone reductase-like Zn-dependent oxidoreductase
MPHLSGPRGSVGPARPACYRAAMKSVQITRRGGPGVLRLVEGPSPDLSPGCVRITVSAAGVNFADLQMRMGLYPEAPRLPFIPGFEVAGVIKETGPGVNDRHAGERVLAMCRFGGYTDEIVVPAVQVRPTPRRLSDVEAASIPLAFMTAWIALMEMGRVREDDRVLVPGAAGGVGSALVQVASRAGARVVGLVGSAEKKDAVRALGAEHVHTYREMADGKGRGRSGTEPEEDHAGFSLILDARGGRELKDALRLLAPAGRVVSYGFSSLVSGPRRSILRTLIGLLRTPLFSPLGLAMGNRGVFGLNLLKLFDTPAGMALMAQALDAVLEGFKDGSFRPVVGKTFPLASAGRAQEYMQSRKNVGKVILTCS